MPPSICTRGHFCQKWDFEKTLHRDRRFTSLHSESTKLKKKLKTLKIENNSKFPASRLYRMHDIVYSKTVKDNVKTLCVFKSCFYIEAKMSSKCHQISRQIRGKIFQIHGCNPSMFLIFPFGQNRIRFYFWLSLCHDEHKKPSAEYFVCKACLKKKGRVDSSFRSSACAIHAIHQPEYMQYSNLRYQKTSNCLNSWMNVKICNDLNKDLPPDCVYDDDSLNGRVRLSPKGIHYVQSLYVYLYRSGWSSWDEVGFEEDVLDTDLTQSFQPTEVLDISIPHISQRTMLSPRG